MNLYRAAGNNSQEAYVSKERTSQSVRLVVPIAARLSGGIGVLSRGEPAHPKRLSIYHERAAFGRRPFRPLTSALLGYLTHGQGIKSDTMWCEILSGGRLPLIRAEAPLSRCAGEGLGVRAVAKINHSNLSIW
jgi:hypothetical protein